MSGGGGFLDWLSGLFASNPQMAAAGPIPLGPQAAQAPAPGPTPNPITGGFDRSARMDAALAGLSQWGQNLATQYQRRPVGAPVPQVPSVTDAVYRSRMMSRQDEQDRAYDTLVAGMDPNRAQLLRAAGPQAGAQALLQSALRPTGGRRMTETEIRDAGLTPNLPWHLDRHNMPTLPSHDPRVAAAEEGARVSARPIVGGGFTGVLPPGYFGQPGAPAAPPGAAPAVAPPGGPTAPRLARGPAPPPESGPGSADEPIPADGVPGQDRPFRADDFNPPDQAAASSANANWRMRDPQRASAALGGTPGRPAPRPGAAPPGVTGGPAAYAAGLQRGPRGELIPAQPPPNTPEGAQDRIVGEVLGNQFKAIEDANTAARTTLSQLDRVQAMFRGVEAGGPLAPVSLRVRAILEQFGVQIGEGVGQEQAAVALANELALQLRNPAGGAGMPGAMSDSDRDILMGMSPGLAQTPQGRELIIEARRRMARRDQEVAQFTRAYMRERGGRLDLNFGDALTAHFASRPLYGPDFQRRMDEIMGRRSEGAGGGAGTPPATGQMSAPQSQVPQGQRTYTREQQDTLRATARRRIEAVPAGPQRDAERARMLNALRNAGVSTEGF